MPASSQQQMPILRTMINKGLFRPDLLYRLAQYTIFISPLRERREDIPLLINHYMQLLPCEIRKDYAGRAP